MIDETAPMEVPACKALDCKREANCPSDEPLFCHRHWRLVPKWIIGSIHVTAPGGDYPPQDYALCTRMAARFVAKAEGKLNKWDRVNGPSQPKT